MLFDLVKVPAHFTGEKYTKKQFWDKYVDIEQVYYSDLNPINHFKISKQDLLYHQTSALSKMDAQFNQVLPKINDFVNAINVENTNLLEQKISTKCGEAAFSTIQDVMSAFVRQINDTYLGSELNAVNITTYKDEKSKTGRFYKGDYSYEDQRNIKDQNAEMFKFISQLIGMDPSRRAAFIQQHDRIVKNNFSKGGKHHLKWTLDEYTKEKSFEVEAAVVDSQLMKELWESLGMKALQTGNIKDSSGKQLIQDAIVFDKNADISFKQTITIEGKAINNLQGLLEALNSKSGKEIDITLPNEIINQILEVQAFSIQSKSSVYNKALLNKEMKRNSISLKALIEITGEFKEELMLLESLNEEYWTNTNTKVFQNGGESEELEALANYLLSKGIAKTNLSKNHIYYTELGFTTASQWAEITKQVLKFHPPIRKLMRGKNALNQTYIYSYD